MVPTDEVRGRHGGRCDGRCTWTRTESKSEGGRRRDGFLLQRLRRGERKAKTQLGRKAPLIYKIPSPYLATQRNTREPPRLFSTPTVFLHTHHPTRNLRVEFSPSLRAVCLAEFSQPDAQSPLNLISIPPTESVLQLRPGGVAGPRCCV